jgi:hypothetical protein
MTRLRVTAILLGLLTLAVSAACARPAPEPSPGAVSPADMASLVGVWQGEAVETGASLYQGNRRVTVTFEAGGSWTATADGVPCAAGQASVRGGRVFLGIRQSGPDACVPPSLRLRDGRMWAAFATSFKGREAPAVIDLQRVGG